MRLWQVIDTITRTPGLQAAGCHFSAASTVVSLPGLVGVGFHPGTAVLQKHTRGRVHSHQVTPPACSEGLSE